MPRDKRTGRKVQEEPPTAADNDDEEEEEVVRLQEHPPAPGRRPPGFLRCCSEIAETKKLCLIVFLAAVLFLAQLLEMTWLQEGQTAGMAALVGRWLQNLTVSVLTQPTATPRPFFP